MAVLAVLSGRPSAERSENLDVLLLGEGSADVSEALAGRIAELRHQISIQDQQTEITRLNADLGAKSSAYVLAASLEQAMEDLALQIEAHRGLLEQETLDHQREVERATQQGDETVSAFAELVTKISASAASVKKELDALPEEPTDGAEAKEALAAQLRERLAKLEQELEASRQAHADKLKANKDELEAFLDAQAAARSKLTQEIVRLTETSKDAEARLQAISQQHLY